jgi:predicted transcriptional regulator YdeE
MLLTIFYHINEFCKNLNTKLYHHFGIRTTYPFEKLSCQISNFVLSYRKINKESVKREFKMMNYTNTNVSKYMTIAGISKIMVNLKNAPQDIAALWDNFNKIENIIPNKANKKIYSTYTNYNDRGHYTCLIGVEVTSLIDLPKKLATITIPAARYARYIVNGPVPASVTTFWAALWNSKLDYNRSFIADFEVYTEEASTPNPQVEIYIARSN